MLKVVKWLFITVVILGLLAAAYTWSVLNWSYSQGERAGYLQKLSKKGFICKTWEGEISLISLPGAAPEKFYFTVPREEVAQKINQLTGSRVSLIYQEHVGIPSSCFGDTSFFVYDVKPLPNMN